VVAYNFLRLVSISSAASFSAFIAESTSGRPPHEDDQHLEIKFQVSSETHSLSDGRLGRSPLTTLYMITPSLAPGKGCSPVTTYTLPSVAIVEIRHNAHLVCDHSKRVDVALLSWVAVLHIEARGVQEFRCHVSDGAHRT
jgi:hypothetical protein